MPQLRSSKVVNSISGMLTSSCSLGVGVGRELGKKLVVKQSPHLAPQRKREQLLVSCLQPAVLSSISSEQLGSLVPMQKDQGESSQRLPGKKAKRVQCRRAVREKKGVALPISETAICEDWQAATSAAAVCSKETARRGTGQGQHLFFSGTTLQNKLSAGIERKGHSLEGLNLSGFQDNSGNSLMEIKLQIPSSEVEIESTERHGISCLPEPEVLQPRKGTCTSEMESTDSIMVLKMQIPDLQGNVGNLESLSELKPQEEVDKPEKLDKCSLMGSRKPRTEKKGRRCLTSKDRTSSLKRKLQGPGERDISALLELHPQCPEPNKRAVSLRKRGRNALVSQSLQDLNSQEQTTTRGKVQKCCMKEEQQSSNPQKGPDSLEESAKETWKATEQVSSTQAVKRLKPNRNRSEDCKEKEPHYSTSPTVATLGGTQSKSFLCRPVTKKSGVGCKTRKRRTDQMKCLQSSSVTTAEEIRDVSAKGDAEYCRNALNHCNIPLCATEKNPFVRLEPCSYMQTFAKSSASGTSGSNELSEFLLADQVKRKLVFPDGTVEQSDMNCSTSRMQNESSPTEGGLFNKKAAAHNRNGCFLCSQSENSKCLRGKKGHIGRKPRKRMKISNKLAAQNVFADVANECGERELQTEAVVAMSSPFAGLGLNHKEITLPASCDHTSNLYTGKRPHEAENVSVWRKNGTKLVAFEDGFKKTPELSVIAEGKNSDRVARPSAASGSLRVLAQDVSSCHKRKTHEKLNKVSKKLQQFTCQRTVPMTGKNVWPVESCARCSEWVGKNHRSISEGKRHLRAAFEESSGKSSVQAVGNSAVMENLKELDLHMSLAEINRESTHKTMDPATNWLTSHETPGSSSVGVYETLRTSNENVKSPVNTDRTDGAFSHDDVKEVTATLNFTTKEKDKNKGAAMKRNLSVTVQNGTSTGKKMSSHKASVVNQDCSDLKAARVLSTGNPTKLKISLCRSKAKSRKLESGYSFERKNCSPLELLGSTTVSKNQKTGEETSLVNSKQQPLPVTSDATPAVSMKKNVVDINSKDFMHNGPENVANETPVLPEHLSLYPHPFLDGQVESSVPDFCGTDVPDHSCNDGSINDDSKSRGNLSQHKKHNLPDILEAYEDDVLLIDVIQDDPDLFETSNEEELAFADCESCPVKASFAGICTNDKKQEIKTEHPAIPKNRDSLDDNFRHFAVRDSGMSNDTENSCGRVLKAKDVKTHNSSRESSPLGGINKDYLEVGQLTELHEFLKSFDMDKKISFADGVPKSEAEKSDCKYDDLVKCELLSELHAPKVNVLNEATVRKPQTTGKSPLLPLQNYRDSEPWKVEKTATASRSVQQILEMIELPRKYCRFYFMTLRGCNRANCWFWHVPEQGHEKVCMAILRTYISIKESGLLKRAVKIFVKYYTEVTPGMEFDSQVLNDLLICLLKNCLLQEVFQILNVSVRVNMLPRADVLLKVFEHVASLDIRDAVPTLIGIFCKLIDAGMFLEFEHFDRIIKFLHHLQVSNQELNTVLNIKSRFQERHFEKDWVFDFSLAVAEIQHCKEKSDWTKLGALYVSARTGCEHFDDLQKLSFCIAKILTRDSETDRPGVPFCDFADAVIKASQHNEADRIVLGRIGINVMYSYHKVQQWTKGRKALDKLRELQIDFTVLKGLIGAERLASRCQIVNKAAEIFLKTASLDGATWVLKESEWTINAPLWPCDKMDILNRHNLLCTLVHKYLRRSLYRQAFEVLQNLPGFQNDSGTVDVSQYSCLFNKLINACFESKNLGVSSAAVDLMLSKNIAIDFFLLRGLITALGRSSLWSKARTYYKSALSSGCYPPLQGNLYHKLLTIPSYLSEVEMLLAIEIFLVSNASNIQSPMASSQTLQIILKRCEDQTGQNNSDYQAAVKRLILAARLSDPKLFLKHMTMNVNMEEVYNLELTSAVKWLKENMKWAGKVWLFQ
ncbi:protein TOPAZ1 [Porphyrio hochstetteri]